MVDVIVPNLGESIADAAIKVDWLYLRKNNLTLCIGTGILPCENNYQMLQTVENLHFLQIAIHYQALNSWF